MGIEAFCSTEDSHKIPVPLDQIFKLLELNRCSLMNPT